MLFIQIIHKKTTNTKNKENIFNLIVQYLEKYRSTVQGLASGEQTRRVTNWRTERSWEMVELKHRQQ